MKEEKFADKIARLEKIVDNVENNVLPLEDALKEYEEGMKIIKECENILSSAQAKVERVKSEVGDK